MPIASRRLASRAGQQDIELQTISQRSLLGFCSRSLGLKSTSGQAGRAEDADEQSHLYSRILRDRERAPISASCYLQTYAPQTKDVREHPCKDRIVGAEPNDRGRLKPNAPGAL
jgi:hypothetical protein